MHGPAGRDVRAGRERSVGPTAKDALLNTKLSRARVFATAGTAATLAHATAAGAEAVVDYRREDVAERIAALTAGRGADRLVEVEFGRNLPLFTRLVRPGGIVSSYGSNAEMRPVFDFAALQAHGLTLHFRSVHKMVPALRVRAIAALPDLCGRGLRLPPVRSFGLADIMAAHEAVEAGAGTARVVLSI